MVSTFVLIYGQRKLWQTTITKSGRGGGGRDRVSIDSSIVK